MSDYSRSMPVMQDVPSQSEEKSSFIGVAAQNITFTQDIIALEIANNDPTATIYLEISGNVATVASGIPIYAKQYYTADRKVKQAIGISIISDTPNTDVRIMGHFKLDSEIS